ncbi:MAG: cytochrome-c peroxidase [Flavobacteriales bacterium]|nr:cytochrome-c peroxidase [Flavobacteriales bacterium]
MRRFALLCVITITILTASSCNEKEAGYLDGQIADLHLEALPPVSHPADNPTSLAKIVLGKNLFWDPIIGGKNDVACVTCHHPDFGYGDGLDLPIGVNGTGLGPDRTENTGGLGLAISRVPRNAPSILNAAYNGLTSLGNYNAEEAVMFWDGRAKSLELQCQGPPTSEAEMRGDAYAEDDALDSVIIRLAATPNYVSLFNAAFGGGTSSITIENYSKAISAFERTIVTDGSPYLRYLNGDRTALNVQEKRGLLLFFGKAECGECHSGPMLSDFDFRALGVPENPAHPEGVDAGLDDKFQFRTPTLHNVELTGPYMHNGMFSTLREVVEFENKGVSQNPAVNADILAHEFEPRGLSSSEMDDIVVFLKSLTDNNFDKGIPSNVPSGLPVGGNIQ